MSGFLSFWWLHSDLVMKNVQTLFLSNWFLFLEMKPTNTSRLWAVRTEDYTALHCRESSWSELQRRSVKDWKIPECNETVPRTLHFTTSIKILESTKALRQQADTARPRTSSTGQKTTASSTSHSHWHCPNRNIIWTDWLVRWGKVTSSDGEKIFRLENI